jgi:hypothetical protein
MHKRTEGLIPCLHFSEKNKKFANLGGVKLKHLLEIQNTVRGKKPHSTVYSAQCLSDKALQYSTDNTFFSTVR